MHRDRLGHYKNYVNLINNEFTDPSDGPPPKNMMVTFQAFLRYVISTNGTGNLHWDNVNQECNPCRYQPNIIIHKQSRNNLN